MQIKSIFETAKDSTNRLHPLPVQKQLCREEIRSGKRRLVSTIHINPSCTFQHIDGFGGALTESAGYVLSLIPKEKRKEALAACFSAEEGIGYTLARTHLNSCDFSLENWACIEHPDESLDSFSMERPDTYITPLIQEAQDLVKSNCAKDSLKLMVSPWSPPAWMKDNGKMNNGGILLKKYYPLWAEYFVRYIDELTKRGIETWAVTVQNEPRSVQTWDSCIWTPAEEGEFAVKHLGPVLEKYSQTSGKRIKIYVTDHNRDNLQNFFTESMSVPGADKYIDGAAFHWYSGDQYENVAKVAEGFPKKDIVFTEGCVEGGPYPQAWFTGERYAHNIINDLNHGCTGCIDWNIALDMQGGPNHVKNFCDAPILVDTDKGTIHYNSSYYYIGHFSRFIRPQARRIDFTVTSYNNPVTIDGYTGNMMECCTFKNTDGSVVLVIMNRTEADMAYEFFIGNESASIMCPPRGIQTVVIDV